MNRATIDLWVGIFVASDDMALETINVALGTWIFPHMFQLCFAARDADTMMVVARTTKAGEVKHRTDGMSLFVLDMKTPGGALDAAIRHHLDLRYLATGQRVPEDLHSANAMYLVDRALRGV